MSSQALPAPASQLFRHLFEQTSLGIALKDLEGKILRANPALCFMLGYTEQELCAMSCSEFANPEDSEDDLAFFQQLRAGVIDHYSLEKCYIKKDGARIWGRLNVSLSKEGDGASPLVFAFMEEVTERKRAEEALRESEQRFRLAMQAGRMYTFDWNMATDEIVRSTESAAILNWERPEHDTGREFHARIHPDDLASYTAVEAGLTRENPTYQITFRTLNPEGRITWLEDTGRAY
ncbi:MAG: PAS domain S-box protein, partial [Candidatus Sulfotelmatobacter sp.]